MHSFTYKVLKGSSLLNETLLQLAKKQHISIPFGCTKGGCGMCKVKINTGKINVGTYSKQALSEQERAQGYTLACQTYIKSDVTITFT
ncbi:MAG TPA: 2Fe-2S iron-sulfur cluster binding domain-containing protein [Massilibacterium sp.]|nr:2Fe-2S iron-sulfur cluster binding domain-containing protein [Massilibacterium sp.]